MDTQKMETERSCRVKKSSF